MQKGFYNRKHSLESITFNFTHKILVCTMAVLILNVLPCRNLHCEMGEQDCVLYCQYLWTCNIIALESFGLWSPPFHSPLKLWIQWTILCLRISTFSLVGKIGRAISLLLHKSPFIHINAHCLNLSRNLSQGAKTWNLLQFFSFTSIGLNKTYLSHFIFLFY